jgi:hypothetical protein
MQKMKDFGQSEVMLFCHECTRIHTNERFDPIRVDSCPFVAKTDLGLFVFLCFGYPVPWLNFAFWPAGVRGTLHFSLPKRRGF